MAGYIGSNVVLLLIYKSHSVIEIARMSDSKIKLLPVRKSKRYISALTNMNLSNNVYKIFGKINLRNYVENTVITKKKHTILCLQCFYFRYNTLAGDYCEGVIPDPIPNSEVKPFSANGTLS